MDPDIVGRLVTEAIMARRLHIITDPRFGRMVNKRFDRIASDFDWAAHSETLRTTGSPGAIE